MNNAQYERVVRVSVVLETGTTGVSGVLLTVVSSVVVVVVVGRGRSSTVSQLLSVRARKLTAARLAKERGCFFIGWGVLLVTYYFFVSVVVVVVFSVVVAGAAGVTMVVFFSITLSGAGAAVLTRASQAIRSRGASARRRCVFIVVGGCVVVVCVCVVR